MRLFLAVCCALFLVPAVVATAATPKQYGGIGIGLSWRTEKHGLTVSHVLKGGPADRAGIKPGDFLTAVNDDSVETWALIAVLEEIRGDAGTEVILTVTREGIHTPLRFRVVRENLDETWTVAEDQEHYADQLQALLPQGNRGVAKAQSQIGDMYAGGQGVTQDYAEAMKWYRKAAEQGDTAAEQAIARMYQQGWGVKKDEAEWLKWLTKAAKQGDSDAQFWLANAYDHQTDMLNYREALKWWRKAAEQNYTGAAIQLAGMYSRGDGVKKNEAEAARWVRRAADKGEIMAQESLGYRYEKGLGVKQNYAEAAKWFLNPAERGSGTAQENLGKLYETGQGVKQDYAEAYYWFSLAAKCGETEPATARDAVAKHLQPEQKAAEDNRVAIFKWPRSVVSWVAGMENGKPTVHIHCSCDCTVTPKQRAAIEKWVNEHPDVYNHPAAAPPSGK